MSGLFKEDRGEKLLMEVEESAVDWDQLWELAKELGIPTWIPKSTDADAKDTSTDPTDTTASWMHPEDEHLRSFNFVIPNHVLLNEAYDPLKEGHAHKEGHPQEAYCAVRAYIDAENPEKDQLYLDIQNETNKHGGFEEQILLRITAESTEKRARTIWLVTERQRNRLRSSESTLHFSFHDTTIPV